jgi:uncharacterized protein (TIGR02246 family)
MDENILDEPRRLETQWNQAIVQNDPEAIGRFMTDDWVIIGPKGGIIDKARFLEVIGSGELTHQRMESDEWRVRAYGNVAVITARSTSLATFKGQVLSARERSTSVYLKQDGRWQCVLTHLTPMTEKKLG